MPFKVMAKVYSRPVTGVASDVTSHASNLTDRDKIRSRYLVAQKYI